MVNTAQEERMMPTCYDAEKTKTSPTDLCVSCGIDTGISKETPVYARPYYVEGSGQLCGSCDNKIYGRAKIGG